MTPTDPEVRRAQEWLQNRPGDWAIGELVDVYGKEMAELLAAYSAEQGQELAVLRDDYRILMVARDQKADAQQAAESQLSTLREGLRARHQTERIDKGSYVVNRCKPDCLRCKAERILSTSEGSQLDTKDVQG